MKKWFVIVLVAVLLTGCTKDRSQQGEPTQSPATEATGFYDPDSKAEGMTKGAVRAYPLKDQSVGRFVLLNGNPVLFDMDGSMTLLEGDTLVPGKTVQLGQPLGDHGESIVVYKDQLACYLEKSREVVIFDGSLTEVQRMKMPEDMQRTPIISLKNSEVYYCAPDQVRVMDMKTGLTALLRSHSSLAQALEGSFFDGDVLACQLIDTQEKMDILHLDAKTGQTIGTSLGIMELYTYGDRYYVVRMDGSVRQQIFGTVTGEPQSLNLDLRDKILLPVLEMNGIVTCDRDSFRLKLYDLNTGRLTSQVDLAGLGKVLFHAADSSRVWFLTENKGDMTLYSWEPGKSPVAEETVYTAPLYTQENPDTEGLALCQERVEALNNTYGVHIQIWEDAMANTGEYACRAEHQVQTINTTLDTLEQTLAKFPQYFLSRSIQGGKIHINIVRSVESPSEGTQFWQGRDGHILLPTNSDIEKAFLLGLGSIVDSHVIGNSRELDAWNENQNPKGFAYDLDYGSNAQREDLTALEGDNPAFLNQISMSFPTEDRRQIFYYAMSPEGEGRFETAALQKKLLVLCSGIREAYNLDKSSDVLPWEQYLQTPLAVEKKS